MTDLLPKETSHRFQDGSTVSGRPEHVATAVAIHRDMAQQERDWIAALRAKGIKAAHPDDGWVNRERNMLHLAYPQFNDGLAAGDLLALGSPYGATRIVRVTGNSENRLALENAVEWYWHFEAPCR